MIGLLRLTKFCGFLLLPKPKTSRFESAASMRKKWTVLDDWNIYDSAWNGRQFHAIFMKHDFWVVIWNIFHFSPLFGEDSHFDEYFSDGLKPPTRICCSNRFLEMALYKKTFELPWLSSPRSKLGERQSKSRRRLRRSGNLRHPQISTKESKMWLFQLDDSKPWMMNTEYESLFSSCMFHFCACIIHDLPIPLPKNRWCMVNYMTWEYTWVRNWSLG